MRCHRRASAWPGVVGSLLLVVACASSRPEDAVVSGSVEVRRSDPGVVTSVVIPPPGVRGSLITAAGRVEWTARHPGCVVLELPSGQRFQLTGTAADDGERQARAGAIPPRQHVEATGHVPPVGATSCGPVRAFWAERVTSIER